MSNSGNRSTSRPDLGYPGGVGFALRQGWPDRLAAILQSRGFSSMREYADANPTRTLVQLADDLGPGDVAAIQLERVLIAGAEATGTLEACVRDLLVRALQTVPWHKGRDWEAQRDAVFALVDWQSCVDSPHHSAALDEVTNALLDNVDIPAGWIPTSSDDPYIVAAFAQPGVIEALKSTTSLAIHSLVADVE